MRRVVVTGLGLVTPLACGVEETWSRLLAGQSGASPITRFKVDDLPTLEHRLDAACVCFISAGTVALRDNRPALLIRDPDGHALLVLGR